MEGGKGVLISTLAFVRPLSRVVGCLLWAVHSMGQWYSKARSGGGLSECGGFS